MDGTGNSKGSAVVPQSSIVPPRWQPPSREAGTDRLDRRGQNEPISPASQSAARLLLESSLPEAAPIPPELLQRVAAGDRAAFAVLYRSSAAKLFGVALRITQ